MRRLIFAAVLLLMCTVVCISGNRYINAKLTVMDKALCECISAASQKEGCSAQQSAEEAAGLWEASEKVFSALLVHSKTDALDIGLPQLRYLAEQGDFEQFRHISLECLYTLRQLEKDQRLSFENVF